MKTLIGKVVGGCQILSELAQGGMGVIYRAKQLSLEREVALKVLADRLAGDPNFVERFQREARAVARVNHPNILAVYDVGQDPDLSLHYMIMELVDGRALSEVMKDTGVLSPKVAAGYIRQAALGLGCAQNAGIVHRDVKPENLMVTRQDVIKVSDFGLAKEVDASTMTATDSVMGTPAYMSPEQCDGKKLDGRTDVYSLGGTFYRLITGRLPFEAETAMSMMYRHKHEPVIPPKQIVAAIPLGLSNVIVKMMAKRREDRYQTLDEVVKAIDEALSQDGGADTQKTMPMTKAAAGAVPGLPIELGTTSPRRREMERLIAQGDARHRRGDLSGAVRLWREAKAVQEDPRIQERLGQYAIPESEKSKATGESKIAEGQLSEAARHYRAALELNPDDSDAAERLHEIEDRLAKRREAVNQARQLLASNRFEEAVQAWDQLPEDFRDESLEKQVRQVRDVVLPVIKLCEQAEAAMEAGELERAMGLFRRAVDVDAQSERARQGLRESERRLGRIERMLKEGYEFNVKEDYERAIEAWTGILKVAPNHAQAKKLIIEARLRTGHGHKQKDGGLQQAIQQWKEILKLDPEHRVALGLLSQDEARQNELGSLSADAQASFTGGRYSRAIARWQRMLDIDPSNRRLEGLMQQARKMRRKRRLVRLLVLIVVVVIGAAVAQLAREWLAIKAAQDLKNKNQLQDAALKLEAFGRPIFLAGVIERDKRSYKLTFYLMEARRLRAEGDYDQATALFEKARGLSHAEDQRIENELGRTEYEQILSAARAAEDVGRWTEAISKHYQALELARKSRFLKEVRESEESLKLARLVSSALRAEQDSRLETARDYWRRAYKVNPDHTAVRKAIVRLGIQP